MTEESLEDRINNASNSVILNDGDTFINIHSEDIDDDEELELKEHQLVI